MRLFTCVVCLVSFSLGHALQQLSFSGGGSFGAVEIGILKRVWEAEPAKKYDLYTGISAGALNAAFLSYFHDMKAGIQRAETIYRTMKTHLVYEYLPVTGLSVLNTEPLRRTLTSVVQSMETPPVIHTLIGTTNLYSSKLDLFSFEEQTDVDKVELLMASSAIPGMFPPIAFREALYADGGIVTNELIQVKHDRHYLNITYITPYEEVGYDDTPITTLKEVLCRTAKIVLMNFNNQLALINEQCQHPIGEIHKYYVPSSVLTGYNVLDFDKGDALVQLGYEHTTHRKYVIC